MALLNSFNSTRWLVFTALATMVSLLIFPPVSVDVLAAPLKGNSVPTISLNLSTLSIDMNLTPGMPTQTASLTATTITDNPAGYNLKLSTNSEYNCLKTTTVADCNGSYNISPVIGSLSFDANFNPDPSALSQLDFNQWGATLTSSFTANTDKGDDVVWFQIPNKNNAV
ncbi:MAG: hypothetical protein LBE03_00760, partial [Candidatus Nomurabacteria bacterium]|nr:hypothetical protein [Candidatus Nomurabacteria bacterium]